MFGYFIEQHPNGSQSCVTVTRTINSYPQHRNDFNQHRHHTQFSAQRRARCCARNRAKCPELALLAPFNYAGYSPRPSLSEQQIIGYIVLPTVSKVSAKKQGKKCSVSVLDRWSPSRFPKSTGSRDDKRPENWYVLRFAQMSAAQHTFVQQTQRTLGVTIF